MRISSNVFFVPASPFLIAWNYVRHEQFELGLEYQSRLALLISDGSNFDHDNPIDRSLLEAEILTGEVAKDDWGWDVLSKIFHFGTKNIPYQNQPKSLQDWAVSYSAHCTEVLEKKAPENDSLPSDAVRVSLPLPQKKTIEMDLVSVLLNRKTCRVFQAKAVELAVLGQILYYSLGYLQERKSDIDPAVPENFQSRRSSPSGGGLNATEGYVYIRACEGLPTGFYRYDSECHKLIFLAELQAELGLLMAGQHFINDLPFGILLVSRFDKLWWKYEHSRAYRMVLIEAGHIAQTIQLVSTALGLKTWVTGAFNEAAIEKILALRPSQGELVFFVGAGYSNGEAIPEVLK